MIYSSRRAPRRTDPLRASHARPGRARRFSGPGGLERDVAKVIDLTGQRFSRLVVKQFVYRHRTDGSCWLCLCDCSRMVLAYTHRLRNKEKESCGCLQREARRISGLSRRRTGLYASLEHGKRLRQTWRGMMYRCNKPTDCNFKNYGARGIRVCDEWSGSFHSFYSWAMSSGFSPELSLDRANNDGDYRPDNCRWVDVATQSRNRRSTRRVEAFGRSMPLVAWCEEYGQPPTRISMRLRAGMTLERALLEPPYTHA